MATTVRVGVTRHLLRQAATMGDLAAVEALVNQALTPRGIQVAVQCQHHCLWLRLACPVLALTLLAQELVQRPTYPTFSVLVSAYHQEVQLWEYSLDLTSRTRLQEVAQGSLLRTTRTPQVQPRLLAPPVSAVQGSVQDLTTQEWQVVAAGLGLAILLLSSEQVTFLLSPLITLVHELGHAATAWLFGYPVIPAFDFRYGGGMTLHGDRVGFLLLLPYGSLGALAYYCRDSRPLLMALGILTGLYTTPIHEMLFVAMGHGFELIFAAIFLYRALTRWGCRYPIERPLYAMLSFLSCCLICVLPGCYSLAMCSGSCTCWVKAVLTRTWCA